MPNTAAPRRVSADKTQALLVLAISAGVLVEVETEETGVSTRMSCALARRCSRTSGSMRRAAMMVREVGMSSVRWSERAEGEEGVAGLRW